MPANPRGQTYSFLRVLWKDSVGVVDVFRGDSQCSHQCSEFAASVPGSVVNPKSQAGLGMDCCHCIVYRRYGPAASGAAQTNASHCRAKTSITLQQLQPSAPYAGHVRLPEPSGGRWTEFLLVPIILRLERAGLLQPGSPNTRCIALRLTCRFDYTETWAAIRRVPYAGPWWDIF